MRAQIVAMGGGGFSMDPDDPALDDFVLGLSGKDHPRVCFVPTASGDAEACIEGFHDAFGGGRARPDHLSLFRHDGTDIAARLRGADVVYVGGGSTVNLLALWRVHGVDVALRGALAAGVVLAGISAGGICWFEGGITNSWGPLRPLHDGLGFLRGSFCPHYDGEPGRPAAYRAAVAAGLPAGLAADDGAAAHFVDGRLVGAVSGRPGAGLRRVELCSSRVLETPLPVRDVVAGP